MGKTSSFTIGRVTGVHGLGGNLKVWSYAQSIDSFCPGKTVLLKSENRTDGHLFEILDAKPYKKGVLLMLDGIEHRDQAEPLVGCDILIHRDQLPEPEADTWYWEDLYGMDVFDHQRGFIGKIIRIFPTGANDILVVKAENTETLVPMQKHFVASVDIQANILKTTLPEDY